MLFQKMRTRNKDKTPNWCGQVVLRDNENCVHDGFWWKACLILPLLFEALGEGMGGGEGTVFLRGWLGPSS